jgi:hypothetical protein
MSMPKFLDINGFLCRLVLRCIDQIRGIMGISLEDRGCIALAFGNGHLRSQKTLQQAHGKVIKG